MIKYKSGTIGFAVQNHSNNYELDLNGIADSKEPPSFSVVIPYYEANETINLCLEHVIKSIQNVTSNHSEIIVVDDGSQKFPATEAIESEFKSQVKMIQIKNNHGRFYCKNAGLLNAKYDLVFFMDADIIIQGDLIENHLKIHSQIRNEGKSGITFSLFDSVDLHQYESVVDKSQLFDTNNDFRNLCAYQESWIGCEGDKEFVGIKYELLKETNNLRNWPESGWIGPWMLPNMVLGGLFVVGRDEALAVGGCSKTFDKYGFEETSLVTKLIAKFDSFVIPEVGSVSLHIDVGNPILNRAKKNLLFRKSHDIYFNEYLNYGLYETIKKDKENLKEKQ